MRPALLRGKRTLKRLILATAVAVIVCPGADAQGTRAAGVAVDAVVTAPLAQTLPVIGRLVATQSGPISAQAAGAVTDVRVDVGSRVTAGEVMVVLDRARLTFERDLRAAELAEAEANLKAARAEIKLRRQELARQEGLKKSAAFSQARLEDKRQEVAIAEAAAAEAEAQLSRRKAALAVTSEDLQDAEITAPFSGVVTQRHVDVGAYVTVGTPVVDLIDDANLEIEADVPAERVAALTPGTRITYRLTVGGSQSSWATVRAAVPQENPRTRTRLVRLIPDPEQSATARASGQSISMDVPIGAARDVVSVHKDAVLNRDGNTIVYKIEGEAAQPQTVKLGDAVGNRFEVLDGLSPGDLVVIRGNERLRPGQKVTYSPPEKRPG